MEISNKILEGSSKEQRNELMAALRSKAGSAVAAGRVNFIEAYRQQGVEATVVNLRTQKLRAVFNSTSAENHNKTVE